MLSSLTMPPCSELTFDYKHILIVTLTESLLNAANRPADSPLGCSLGKGFGFSVDDDTEPDLDFWELPTC